MVPRCKLRVVTDAVTQFCNNLKELGADVSSISGRDMSPHKCHVAGHQLEDKRCRSKEIGLGKECSSDPSPYAHPKAKDPRIAIDWKKEARELYQSDAANYAEGAGWLKLKQLPIGFESRVKGILGNPKCTKVFDDGKILGFEFPIETKYPDLPIVFV